MFAASHGLVRNNAERDPVQFFYPISPTNNILQNESTVSQTEYWHWHSQAQKLPPLVYKDFSCCLFIATSPSLPPLSSNRVPKP